MKRPSPRRSCCLLAAATLAGCGGDAPPAASSGRTAAAAPDDWRAQLAPADRERLRDWRTAFTLGLAQARASGAGARIAAEGVLLQPDVADVGTMPPDGTYRCRVVKLGRRGASGPAYLAYPRFACRIEAGRLTKLDGSQRPDGLLRRSDDGRITFVGGMALGDERGTVPYGRDAERDMVGHVERIGPARWRLVLPYPRWESLVDIFELVPMS